MQGGWPVKHDMHLEGKYEEFDIVTREKRSNSTFWLPLDNSKTNKPTILFCLWSAKLALPQIWTMEVLYEESLFSGHCVVQK